MPSNIVDDRTEESLTDCINFIKFCDKYDIHEVVATAYQSLLGLMRDQGDAVYLKAEDVSTLASLLPQDHAVFHVLYAACVERIEKEAARPRDGFPFRDLLKTDDRVALGIMRLLTRKLVREHRKEKPVFELPVTWHDGYWGRSWT